MNRQTTVLIICLCSLLGFILAPSAAIQGAQNGLNAFLNTVLPALLPFYVGTNILVKSGAVRKISKPLGSITQPIFRLPGESAFAFCMGALSGYPLGARLTQELFASGSLRREEALRTLALSFCCGPGFMIGAVGTGLLQSPSAGALITICHITAALLMGILFRFWGEKPTPRLQKPLPSHSAPSIQKGLLSLCLDSVTGAAQSLWGVGSFIIFFSSVSGVLQALGIYGWIGMITEPLLQWLGLPPQLSQSFLCGSIEMTSGCISACQTDASIYAKVIVCSILIGFGGCCVLAQGLAETKKLGVPLRFFISVKLLHAALSLCLVLLLFPYFPIAQNTFLPDSNFSSELGITTLRFFYAVFALLVLAVGMALYNLRNAPKKRR